MIITEIQISMTVIIKLPNRATPSPKTPPSLLLLKTFSCFPICLYCTPVRHKSLLHSSETYVSIALHIICLYCTGRITITASSQLVNIAAL